MNEKQFAIDMMKDETIIDNKTLMRKYNFKNQKEMFAKFDEIRIKRNIKLDKMDEKDAKDLSKGLKQIIKILK